MEACAATCATTADCLMTGVAWCRCPCFGLGMVALDIRQESTRHTDALDAITTHLGIGSYKCALQWGSALCFPAPVMVRKSQK